MRRLLHLIREDGAASAVEYALLLAIIGGALAIAAIALGQSVGGAMTRTANTIENAG